MSITFPTIIEVSDYRTFQQGNNSPLRDEDIQSAINTSFVQLDGICNSQISIRWIITDENDPMYLNATKKGNIQKAFLLQTKYNLDYDNDTSEGTSQSNWGSNSTSITRPKRDKISQDVLNYLTLAGVYVQFTTMKSAKPDIYCPSSPRWDIRFDAFATKEWANQSFIPKQCDFTIGSGDKYILYYGDNKQAQSSKLVDLLPRSPRNAFLYLTTLGKLKWVPISEVIGGYWGGISGEITDQEDLMEYFARYYTKSEIDSNFYKKSETYGIYDAARPTETTYNAASIDTKIATMSGHFLATLEGGATEPLGFDYDTFIKQQLQIEGITPENHDWVLVLWTDNSDYDKCVYNGDTNTWSKEYRFTLDAGEYIKSAQVSGNTLTLKDKNDNPIVYEPTIPTQQQSDWNQTDNTKVDYIKNKPTIPTKTSQLQNDSGFITSSSIPHLYEHRLVVQESNGWYVFSNLYSANPTEITAVTFPIDYCEARGWWKYNNEDYTLVRFGYDNTAGSFYVNATKKANQYITQYIGIREWHDYVRTIF